MWSLRASKQKSNQMVSVCRNLQGSLSLKLPVGKAVVQSLSFHPTETRLLTAMEGQVQVWGTQPEEAEDDDTLSS